MGWNLLTSKVLEWAEVRGIFKKATPLSQLRKSREEFFEMADAIEEHARLCIEHYSQREPPQLEPEIVKTLGQIKDGIGDTLVTLTLLSRMYGWTLEECMEAAYAEIKDRKGKMVNGLFVKEVCAQGEDAQAKNNTPKIADRQQAKTFVLEHCPSAFLESNYYNLSFSVWAQVLPNRVKLSGWMPSEEEAWLDAARQLNMRLSVETTQLIEQVGMFKEGKG